MDDGSTLPQWSSEPLKPPVAFKTTELVLLYINLCLSTFLQVFGRSSEIKPMMDTVARSQVEQLEACHTSTHKNI